MHGSLIRLPPFVTFAAGIALLLHGPIPQFADYHDFADQRVLLGVRNGANVLSNIAFAIIGFWGFLRLWPMRAGPELMGGWPGYRLFLAALLLTAAGSAYYHLAPDDGRLLWDRLPIALACAGLLLAVRGETRPEGNSTAWTLLVIAAAVASVAWWHITADLRPYLLVQTLPLALIPLWQAIYPSSRTDRVAYAAAITLYLLAKIAELEDREVLTALGWISGHTLKHVLAAAAAAAILGRLSARRAA